MMVRKAGSVFTCNRAKTISKEERFVRMFTEIVPLVSGIFRSVLSGEDPLK